MSLMNKPVQLLMLEPSQIDEGERARKEYGNLNELAESIREHGLIHPIALKEPTEATRQYTLLAGGRRLRACTIAKLEKIPCRVYPSDISELEKEAIELAENLHRENLSYPEEVALCKRIHQLQTQIYGKKLSTAKGAPGWSQADTAKMLRRSPGVLTSDLHLADAIENMPELASLKNKSEALRVLSMLQEEEVKKELAKRLGEVRIDSDEVKAKAKLCNSFILKDFFIGVKDIPDGTIDLVEVDAPYAIDLRNLKKLKVAAEAQMEGYNEIDVSQYPVFLSTVIRESWRVLRDSGWLILWFAPEPWFEPVYQWITRAGFACSRLPGAWVKMGTPGQSQHPEIYLASNYELFFYARKRESTIAQMGRFNTFLHYKVTPGDKKHPTERPIELMEDILKTFAQPGSRILVPFLGSGNTLMAAANLDMEAFGFELTEKYKDAFVIEVHARKYGIYYSRRKE